jgi:hypothetical protein
MMKDLTGELSTQTPEDILGHAVKYTRSLGQEVCGLLYGGDLNLRKAKLRERAEFIAGLPKRILTAAAETGQEFPDEELQRLRTLERLAREALETGDGYSLGSILSEQGMTTNEPNLLERVTLRVYPQIFLDQGKGREEK